jgi:hypothetical protein
LDSLQHLHRGCIGATQGKSRAGQTFSLLIVNRIEPVGRTHVKRSMPATLPVGIRLRHWSAHLAVLFVAAVLLPETAQAMHCGAKVATLG